MADACQILMNPLTQQSSNRDGIAYVVSRMDWYWHLADLLLERNQEARRSQPLQDQLEKNLVDLYTRLLAYQIKSIVTYHRRRGAVFARDLVKWDKIRCSGDPGDGSRCKYCAQSGVGETKCRFGVVGSKAVTAVEG